MRTIITFWLLVICSFSVLGQQPSTGKNTKPPESQTPTDIKVTSNALDSLAQSVEAVRKNTEPNPTAENEKKEREIKDLEAQQTVALYAKRTFWAAVAQVFVGVGTVIGLITAITQTNKIIRQDRAWVSASAKEVSSDFYDPVTKYFLSVTHHFVIKNVGKTPALRVSSFCGEFRDYPAAQDYDAAIAKMRTLPRQVISPESEMLHPISFTDSEMEKIRVGGGVSIIYICAEYETIYGEKFLLQDTVQTNIVLIPTGPDSGDRMFRFTPYGPRNSIEMISK